MNSIGLTSDEGFILGGFSNSNISGDKTENCKGGADFWIVKLDSLGNIQWQKTIGGSGDDVIYYLEQSNDNGFIVCGSSNSNISGDKTENVIGANNYYDYWILKLDSIGIIVWQNTIGGDKEDVPKMVHQTFDLGYIISGESISNISGDKSENSFGQFDFWVVKLFPNGTIEWQKTIGGNLWEYGSSVIQSNGGGYLICGASYSGISGNKSTASLGGFDYWVVKLNASGSILWQMDYGGLANEGVSFISKTSDGNYLLAGNSASYISGNKTEDAYGGSDYWVFKIDNSGNIIWQKDFGGIDTDVALVAIGTNDNGYFIGGYSISNISGNKTENNNGGGGTGENDYWVIKLAPDNNCTICHKPTNLSSLSISNSKEKLMWTTEPCAIGYRVYHRAIGTSNWIVNVVGSNNGFKTISGLTPNTTYEWRVRSVCSNSPFIASFATTIHTFTTPLRLEDETKTQNNFILYPNPATNEIKISNLSSEENQIKIFNLLGQQAKSLSMSNEQNHTINISDLSSGIYMLTVSNNKKISCKKFVKE